MSISCGLESKIPLLFQVTWGHVPWLTMFDFQVCCDSMAPGVNRLPSPGDMLPPGEGGMWGLGGTEPGLKTWAWSRKVLAPTPHTPPPTASDIEARSFAGRDRLQDNSSLQSHHLPSLLLGSIPSSVLLCGPQALGTGLALTSIPEKMLSKSAKDYYCYSYYCDYF